MSKISTKANFDIIRYAQVWEDSDILLEALQIKKDGNYLSIASGGDNTLAMLSKSPKQLIALDLNQTQLYLLELKVTAFKELDYENMLAFLGVTPSTKRLETFKNLSLSSEAKKYWSEHQDDIMEGVIHIGKFERYFQMFSKKIIPLIHSKKRVTTLLQKKPLTQRKEFYKKEWNNLRWNILFRIFFSQTFMGLKGRDRAFFEHVSEPVSKTILEHTKYALTMLDPYDNPYLHYILHRNYSNKLPYYLRKEHFHSIKENLDKLSWHHQSIETYTQQHPALKFDGYNLSDIFEYMSEEEYEKLLKYIHTHSNREARLVYWNMMVTRKHPKSLKHLLHSCDSEAQKLYAKNKTFFYKDFIIEKVI